MAEARDGHGYRPIGLVAAAVMGATWLVGGLVSLARFSLIFGLAFVCHQIGGFAGSWMGALVLDETGGHDATSWALIGIDMAAAPQQWPMNDRPHLAGGLAREAVA